jgi:hypothetical protein
MQLIILTQVSNTRRKGCVEPKDMPIERLTSGRMWYDLMYPVSSLLVLMEASELSESFRNSIRWSISFQL